MKRLPQRLNSLLKNTISILLLEAQRFTAAITGLFAVPASQAAEKLTEGQPPLGCPASEAG
jgi:hypothetical protein